MAAIAAYANEAEIEEVVRKFEECEWTPEEFVHAKHLTVAAQYFVRYSAEEAAERMRAGLRRFIRHHGKNGYHETVTEFWLRMVEREVRGAQDAQGQSGNDVVAMANAVVKRLGDKNLIYRYYSRERVASAEAKARVIGPDLDGAK